MSDFEDLAPSSGALASPIADRRGNARRGPCAAHFVAMSLMAMSLAAAAPAIAQPVGEQSSVGVGSGADGHAGAGVRADADAQASLGLTGDASAGTARETDPAANPQANLTPPALAPTTLPLRLPRREVGIGFGISRVAIGDDSLSSVTGTLFIDTRTGDDFSIRLGLPLASADAAMVGDLDIDFGWLLWTDREGSDASLLSFAIDVTVPTNQLNTLGGGRDEIRARRLSRYPTVSRLNLMPLRYLQALPHVGFYQQFDRLALYADLGPALVLACRFPNYYDSPQLEAAIQYGFGAAFEILTPDSGLSLAAGLEVSGTHFLTTVGPSLDNQVGSNIAAEPREDRDGGLSIAPSLRAFISERISLVAGVQVAAVNEQTFSRYTPTTLWLHDYTIFANGAFAY